MNFALKFPLTLSRHPWRWVLVGAIAGAGSVQAADPRIAQQSAEVRGRLTPAVQSVLSENCGEDCPSFRIEPRFATAEADPTQDLGFTKPGPETIPPALRSVSLDVLVKDRVPRARQAYLRQILMYRLANDSGVPVNVSFKSAAAEPVAAAFDEHPPETPEARAIAWARILAWPVALVLLLGQMLLGLRWLLRRRDTAPAAHEPGFRDFVLPVGAGAPLEMASGVHYGGARAPAAELARILDERGADLAWWIEDRAVRGDLPALTRLLEIVPAPQLSAGMALSANSLGALARALPHPSPVPGTAGPGAAPTPGSPDRLVWIAAQLDQAHIGRLSEEAEPLRKLDRIPDAQITEFLSDVPAALERGLVLSALAKSRLPALLGRIGSEQRIAFASDLDAYTSASGENQRSARAAVESRVRALRLREPTPALRLEDWALFLSEKEAVEIARRLPTHSATTRPASLAQLIESMETDELLEVCLAMDLKNLRLLLENVSGPNRAKILGGLPSAFRTRLLAASLPKGGTPGNPDAQSADLIRARADLVATYRKLSAQGLAQ